MTARTCVCGVVLRPRGRSPRCRKCMRTVRTWELLPSVEDHLAAVAARLGYASAAEALAAPEALPAARWGDPIRLGERVHLTSGCATAMHSVGRLPIQRGFVVASTAAALGGTVIALGEDLDFLATVRWDDGHVQKLHVGSIIPSSLRGLEAAVTQRAMEYGL